MRGPFTGFMTLSGQEFNRNPSAAKRSAKTSPVVVLDHGEPDVVVISAADFEMNYRPVQSAGDLLDDPDSKFDREFEVPRMTLSSRPVEF